VQEIALRKLSPGDRDLVAEAYRIWRSEEQTEAHRRAYARWEVALDAAITELQYPVRCDALDWGEFFFPVMEEIAARRAATHQTR
jgi:hypothetical protein